MALGYLLHSRPYRETSRIASFLTDTDGRVDVLMRPLRSKARRAFVPVPFCRYELAWTGRAALPHLQHWESAESGHILCGNALYCGLYVNELLYLLLPPRDEDSVVMDLYADVLLQLSRGDVDVEPVLRNFELSLLDVLGYGLSLHCHARGVSMAPESMCYFELGVGLLLVEDEGVELAARFSDYQSIACRDFSRLETRRLCKRLMRKVLSHHLGGRPIRSRELFQ